MARDDNPVYDVMRDESRSALRALTEMERVDSPRIVGGVYRMGEPEDER